MFFVLFFFARFCYHIFLFCVLFSVCFVLVVFLLLLGFCALCSVLFSFLYVLHFVCFVLLGFVLLVCFDVWFVFCFTTIHTTYSF